MIRLSLMPCLQLVGLSGLMWSLAATLGLPVRADVPLTRADVESLYNEVELIPDGREARPANLSDWLSVGDALRTALGARAELRFNDGSLARVGERATFWFVPNTRNFRLSNGTALFLIPPGQGPSNIQTPSAVTGIQGTALVVRHIPRADCDPSSFAAAELACPGRTVVMVLTDSPKGPVEISTNSGNSVTLSAGDLAVIENDAIEVMEFNLQLFYETSPLVEGLGLNNPDYEGTGSPTDPVRQETWDGIQSQQGFTGNYLLNPELISVDAQLGISTSWLLPTNNDGNTAVIDGMTDEPVSDIRAVDHQRPSGSAGARALMSSWFANTSPDYATPQAAVPGIVSPPGVGSPSGRGAIAPVGNPIQPTAARGSQPPRPTSSPARQPGANPSQPTQPVRSPIGNPSMPAPGVIPVVPPSTPAPPGTGPAAPPTTPAAPGAGPTGPTPPGETPGEPVQPEVPFDPGGGAPPQPGPAEQPGPPPTEPPPTDVFNPPGNEQPTGDPGFTPPGNPEQPQGVPFDPGGGAAPPPDPTGGGAPGGLTTPIPETNFNPQPVETVPEAAAPNEFPGDVLLEGQPPQPTESVATPPAEETPATPPPEP